MRLRHRISAVVLLGIVAVLPGVVPGGGVALAGPALGDDPFVAAATHPSGHGLWLLDGDGQVFEQGRAADFGDVGELRRAGQIGEIEAVDIVPTKTGRGYWVFDRIGGVYTFGDATFHGSLPGVKNAGGDVGEAPVIAAAVTPSGGGYYMLDAEGGIFTFGDATFHGSVPGLRRSGVTIGNAPGVAFAVVPQGGGYVVMDNIGGLFTFGGASFFGSVPGLRESGVDIGRADVMGVVMSYDGQGYWMTDAVGGVFSFGTTDFHGSMPGRNIGFNLVDQAVMPDGSGYWMMDEGGRLAAFGTAEQVPNVGIFSPAATRGADPDIATSFGPDFGNHAFIKQHDADGAPVRLNPCRAHRYVVHLGTGAPGNGVDLAKEAVRRLEAETTMTFVYSGTTAETFASTYNQSRAVFNHPSYGKTWTPLLVAFEPFDPLGLAANQIGITGNRNQRNRQGGEVTTTTETAIATDRGLSADFADGGLSMGKVLMHELGHAVGLDHPSAGDQVMTSGYAGQTAFQAGDKEGFRKVGAPAGCVLEP